MNLHDLRQAQANFASQYDKIFEERKNLFKKRDAFVKNFNLQKIEMMHIDEYVLGIKKDAFCRIIERNLDGLGRITGSNAFKFGIYFGKTKQDPEVIYRNSSIWGESPEIAFNNIKPAIIRLINDGINENIDSIVKNKISPMFKGKILSIYYPERYLNVFSDEHLKYFIKSFDLDNKITLKLDPVLKRELLLDFKNNDIVMKNWSTDMFSVFLYNFYPKRPTKNPIQVVDILEDYYEPNFPPNPTGSEIVLNILPFAAPISNEKKQNKNSKPDYEKSNRLNKKLGDRGEKVVLDFERERLKNSIYKDQVERVSLISDSLGYDIKSFEEDGQKRYIEVKATRSKVGDANFFLTINELITSKEKENYYIYLVYEILSDSPKIWIIDNPFNPENININIEPINFKVSIKVK